MQGTPAVLYAGHVQISVRTVLHGMVLSKLFVLVEIFFSFFLIFYWPASFYVLVLCQPAAPPVA